MIDIFLFSHNTHMYIYCSNARTYFEVCALKHQGLRFSTYASSLLSQALWIHDGVRMGVPMHTASWEMKEEWDTIKREKEDMKTQRVFFATFYNNKILKKFNCQCSQYLPSFYLTPNLHVIQNHHLITTLYSLFLLIHLYIGQIDSIEQFDKTPQIEADILLTSLTFWVFHFKFSAVV